MGGKLKIAIVGGGLTGCLAALEFAERGHSAVILEKERDLLLRASTANEGKVHLGYVYAADKSFQTAARLIDDALLFRPMMERWITPEAFDRCILDPFDYVVPEGSSLSVAEIRSHFERVEAHVQERSRELRLNYLGEPDAPSFSEIEPPSSDSLARFRTQERGVWPIGIAELVRGCVAEHPRVRVEKDTAVDRIVADGQKWKVVLSDDAGMLGVPFDIIINASWANRLDIDRKSGYAGSSVWMTRFKFGVLLDNASSAFGGKMPTNLTGVSGAFGDSVYFRQNDTLYNSWYPVGMCFSTPELFQDTGKPDLGEAERLIRETWNGYSAIDPSYRQLDAIHLEGRARLIGDYIVARGKSDIDNPTSELHQRSRHGSQQLAPGYWTVDTGKFTSSPRCASECVDLALAGS